MSKAEFWPAEVDPYFERKKLPSTVNNKINWPQFDFRVLSS